MVIKRRYQSDRNPGRARRTGYRQSTRRRRAFLLLMVTVVITLASLAALNFSRSMLISHEVAVISRARLQAQMAAESHAQAIRLLLAYPPAERLSMGGTWNNPTWFQAVNVVADPDPARRVNVTVLAPSLDDMGNLSGLRYGLQNESAKLNLNALMQLDALAAEMSAATNAGGLAGQVGVGGAAAGLAGASEADTLGVVSLASATTNGTSTSLATSLLMGLPGMTPEIADAILDFIDEDEEPRPYGAEYADYYSQLQPPYKPPNGPLQSIEQLLLVRGVTPAMLFGYDENRNGFLDAEEQAKMNAGIEPGQLPGAVSSAALDPDATPPPPLGWAQYLTLHSQEKNVARDGTPRININAEDLEQLYEDLVAVLGNEDWASFIVAYRIAGQSGNGGVSPLVTLATMAAADSQNDGVMEAQLNSLAGAGNQQQSATSEPPQVWSAAALQQFDLSRGGEVQFTQVLDLIDARVTVQPQGNGGQGEAITYASPFTSLPLDLANSTPILMDYLTTVDAPSIPGRINIMECPQEILRGLPGLSDEVVDEILQARIDGSDSETRQFETWLAIEGYLTMDQLRALVPLITCGGDVYKAQIIGYTESGSAFARIETIISGAGELPEILFFRRLDHLGRGFEIPVLGQRFDAVTPGNVSLSSAAAW